MRTFTEIETSLRPFIIAHRGSSTRAHENTIEAFEAAIEDKADAIEFDVRRTADGELIVHHDGTVSGQVTAITDQGYIEVLRAGMSRGFQIPRLIEVVNLCADRIALDVELKEEGYEKEIFDVVTSKFDLGQVLFKSFSENSIKLLKSYSSEVRVGLLLGVAPPAPITVRFSELFPSKRLDRVKADFVAPHWKLVRFGFFGRMRKRNIPVFVWTVDDPGHAKRLLHAGARGIITNRPALIRSALEG